jgi:hypothetical protein
LLRGVRDGRPIFVTEGEKDADAIAEAGQVATTAFGGARNWLRDYDDYFRGADVYVVADRDRPGLRHALQVKKHLNGVAASVDILLPAAGKDAADHLHNGLTVDQFEPWRPALGLAGPQEEPESETKGETTVTVRRASEVRYEPLEWLWDGWVPKGNLTLFAGPGGVGKSHFLLTLAARLSQGDGLNDGRSGNTLILSAEDDFARVIKPRLVASGADLDRVVEAVIRRDGWDELLSFPDHHKQLIEVVRREQIDLVIIDPGSAFWSISDSHNDMQIRRVLGPLAKIAMDENCAIVFLVHLNRARGSSFVDRINGSVGQANAARAVLGMAPHPQDEGKVVLAWVKGNYAERQKSLVYELEEANLDIDGQAVTSTRLKPVGTTDLTANDLVAPAERAAPQFDEAVRVMNEAIANGPVTTSDLKQQLDVSEEVFSKAKQQLGAITKKLDGIYYTGFEADFESETDPTTGESEGRMSPDDPLREKVELQVRDRKERRQS